MESRDAHALALKGKKLYPSHCHCMATIAQPLILPRLLCFCCFIFWWISVMRLSRPTLVTSYPITCEAQDIPGEQWYPYFLLVILVVQSTMCVLLKQNETIEKRRNITSELILYWCLLMLLYWYLDGSSINSTSFNCN